MFQLIFIYFILILIYIYIIGWRQNVVRHASDVNGGDESDGGGDGESRGSSRCKHITLTIPTVQLMYCGIHVMQHTSAMQQ